MSRTQRRSTRRLVLAIVVFGAALLASAPAAAQTYPSRTIEWISHSSAGSGTDATPGRNSST